MDIEKEYLLPFPCDVVYDAWLSSETVIPPATAMDIDPKVGGHFRLFVETPEFSSQMEGEFLEVESNRRIRYTWQWKDDPESTEVDVTFAPNDDGGTLVKLLHSGFSGAESHALHDSGWDSYIQGLKAFLSGISVSVG